MKQVSYTDESGRKWATLIPDNVPKSSANMGIPLGPPDLSGLNLEEELAVRLHNQLFERRLLTLDDVRRNRDSLVAAVMSAAKFDANRIVAIYKDRENGKDQK